MDSTGTRRRVLYWVALVLSLSLLAAYAQHRQLYQRFVDYKQSEERVNSMADQLDALETREQAMSEHVQEMTSDPVEMEATVRRNKHLVREGETVFRIKPIPADRPRDAGLQDTGVAEMPEESVER